eukprot:763012-Hanusia_phi.AAC.2
MAWGILPSWLLPARTRGSCRAPPARSAALRVCRRSSRERPACGRGGRSSPAPAQHQFLSSSASLCHLQLCVAESTAQALRMPLLLHGGGDSSCKFRQHTPTSTSVFL